MKNDVIFIKTFSLKSYQSVHDGAGGGGCGAAGAGDGTADGDGVEGGGA